MNKAETLYKQYKSIISSKPKGLINKASLIIKNLNGDTSKAIAYISNFTEEELKVIFEYKSKITENRKYSIDEDRVLTNMLRNQENDYDYQSSYLKKSSSYMKRRCFQLRNMFDLMKKRKKTEEDLNLIFKNSLVSRTTTDYSNNEQGDCYNTVFNIKDSKQRHGIKEEKEENEERLLKKKRNLKENQSRSLLINSFISIYDYLMTIIDENSSYSFEKSSYDMFNSHINYGNIKEILVNSKKKILNNINKINDENENNSNYDYILDNLKLCMSFLKLNLIIKKRKEEESV